jgi:HAE1 family hydrophobic/amphiphilic exporter-1
VIVRANASGGNGQLNRFLSGGNNGGGRLSLEIRGEDLDDARKLSQATKDLLDTVPGVADARLGRDEGRPELAVRIDRAKAAMLGVSATTLANTIRTNVAGTQAAQYREHGNEYPIVVRLREDERQGQTDVEDVTHQHPQGQVMPAKNLMRMTTPSVPCRFSGRISSALRLSAPSPKPR